MSGSCLGSLGPGNAKDCLFPDLSWGSNEVLSIVKVRLEHLYFSKASTHPENAHLRVVRTQKLRGCMQTLQVKISFPFWASLAFTSCSGSKKADFSRNLRSPQHRPIRQPEWAGGKRGGDARTALVLWSQGPPWRRTGITYWCCRTESACTAQTPRRATDSSRRLPPPRCLAGWCWLWALPPGRRLCERDAENDSVEPQQRA